MKSIKFFLKSLFSNKTVLEGRNKKWWVGVLVLLVSLILSIIPTMVTVGTAKGSSFTNSQMLSTDVGLEEFSKYLLANNIDLIVTNKEGESVKKQLILTSQEEMTLDNDSPIYTYVHKDGGNDVKRLNVYYRDEASAETTAFIRTLQEQLNETSDAETQTNPPISFLILARERMYMAIYAKNADNWARPATQYSGTYLQIKENTNVDTLITLELWKGFFDDGYLSIRSSALLVQTGAYVGINLLVILFMGLMIFIVTRGKNNPYRSEYNFGKSMLVIFFASLCPAILTCAIGFALPQYAPMIFMMTLGFRAMWMTSKNLNPATAAQNR